MLKNYFVTAWRSLQKNKFYSIINISGLAVGLATAVMLLLWVQNELSYDKFNTNYTNIYQLSSHFNSGGEERTWKGVPGPLAVLAKSMPNIQSFVRTESEYDQIIATKDRSKMLDGNRIACVDSSFFSMFSYPLLQGNRYALFPNNNAVVLTQSLAKKLFGSEDAMGKTITFYKNYFTVTGVMKDFPANSSLQYDAIFSMGFYAQQFTEEGGNGDWKTIDEDLGDYSFITYVQLTPGADAAQTERAFSTAFKKIKRDSDASFQLQNLADIHLTTAEGDNAALRTVQIFLLIVILLLSIASINYVNLSTARSLLRAKEVSIRKIIGANKKQLFLQFIIETAMLFCFSLAMAIVFIYLLMPLYNAISGKELSFSLQDVNVWKAIFLAITGTLLASSIYPAVLLSSFKPIQSLKGKITSGIGVAVFRKALVVFQFTISVVLIVCTITMSKQLSFIKTKDVGYDRSYVFNVPLTDEVVTHIDAVKAELSKQPGVLNAGVSDAYDLTDVGSSSSDLDWPAKPASLNLMITQVSADKDFIPTMKIKLVEGTNFTGMPADSASYILNETAAKKMGLKKPYTGQQISLHGKEGTITGVVQDFNFQSLKEQISPLIFFTRSYKNILYVRTTAGKAQQVITLAEQQYKKYAGNIPFTYHFLDKSFADQYQAEQQAGTLFNVFAGIAIFISCLGLFGLATYMAQVKIKEIGIRKVLGANITNIVQLLSKDFIVLVIVAVIIATPVAWWAMDKWLQGFAYRIHLSWLVFLLAGIIALAIALVTISFQAIKAAIANPVKSLRTE